MSCNEKWTGGSAQTKQNESENECPHVDAASYSHNINGSWFSLFSFKSVVWFAQKLDLLNVWFWISCIFSAVSLQHFYWINTKTAHDLKVRNGYENRGTSKCIYDDNNEWIFKEGEIWC